MDPDYIDPATLRERAAAKGHQSADVTVGPRPRLKPGKSTGIRVGESHFTVQGSFVTSIVGVANPGPSSSVKTSTT